MDKLRRVLICEDSRIVGRLLECTTSKYGYSTDAIVQTGEEAIEQVVKNAPDLVLMDVGLPGITGIEAAKIIKRLSPETRVILVTAQRPCISEILVSGIDGLCTKDLLSTQLYSAIKASEDGICWLDLRVA